MGIHVDCRSTLTFGANPTCFKDLDDLCILSENFKYNDMRLGNVNANRFKGIDPHVQPKFNSYKPVEPRRCFGCQKIGHVIKNCYYNNKMMLNNSKNPKNL